MHLHKLIRAHTRHHSHVHNARIWRCVKVKCRFFFNFYYNPAFPTSGNAKHFYISTEEEKERTRCLVLFNWNFILMRMKSLQTMMSYYSTVKFTLNEQTISWLSNNDVRRRQFLLPEKRVCTCCCVLFTHCCYLM